MKFFKYQVCSIDDPDIIDLIEDFGHTGYYVFFGILDIMSREFDTNNPAILLTNRNFLSKRLKLSWKKIEKILKKIAEKKRMEVKIDGNEIYLNCPKLKALADNYTTKVLQGTASKCRTQVGFCADKKEGEVRLLNTDTDTDILSKDNIAEPCFNGLWIKYPSKDGRKEALRHFAATVKTEKDYADIQKALSNYLSSKRVKEGFVKNGSTWFNNWRDWVDYKEPSKCDTIGHDYGYSGKCGRCGELLNGYKDTVKEMAELKKKFGCK